MEQEDNYKVNPIWPRYGESTAYGQGSNLPVWKTAAKLSGTLTSTVFKILTRKENVSNVRKGNDILQFRWTRILRKMNN
jgi:hypothetical protein